MIRPSVGVGNATIERCGEHQ